MYPRYPLLVAALAVALCAGCPDRYRADLDYDYEIAQHWQLEDVAFGPLAQFSSVDWHPDDTAWLRELIVGDRIAAGRTVLELGTRTGLVAILCLQQGASRVVAVDTNPAAVANARYNAAALESEADLQVLQQEPRTKNPLASVNGATRYDLVILNDLISPRAHQAVPCSIDAVLDGLPDQLQPGGRCFIYTQRLDRLRQWQTGAERRNYVTESHDTRNLDTLPAHFFPATLLEISL